ncbi:hypothetical protein NA78x_004182 [Anatilimnocola sp. NA78]|uniref:hypothetical protein n=1 Tax=Anatilimnocola sp. NA78 TaxID=3415683 RepID=UPI003CE56F78
MSRDLPTMRVYKLNKPLFQSEASHPARRFLEAFVTCRKLCVGRELEGIDQRWQSTVDGRERKFSSYAYEALAFDVILDGWLTDAKGITDSEQVTLNALPAHEQRMRECREAAILGVNTPVVQFTNVVLEMFALWRHAIEYRIGNLK